MTAIADLAPQLIEAKAAVEADELRAEIQSLTERLDRTRRHLKSEKAHSKRLRRRLDQIATNNQEDTVNTNETTNNDQIQEDTMTDTETTITDQTTTPEALPQINDTFAPYRDHAPELNVIPASAWTTVEHDGQTIILHAESEAGTWTGWVAFREGEGFTVGVDAGDGRIATGKHDIVMYANWADDHGLEAECAFLDDMTALAAYLEHANAVTEQDAGEADAAQAREAFDRDNARPEPGAIYERKMEEQNEKARELRAKAANGKLTGDPVRRETLDLLRDLVSRLDRIARALEGEATA